MAALKNLAWLTPLAVARHHPPQKSHITRYEHLDMLLIKITVDDNQICCLLTKSNDC
jgi:hypothetical protein